MLYVFCLFVSKEKAKAKLLHKRSHRSHTDFTQIQQNLSVVPVCSNKPTNLESVLQSHCTSSSSISSPQIGTDSYQEPKSGNFSCSAVPYHTEKKITTKCEDIITKACPSFSKDIIRADPSSMKVLMEDKTTSFLSYKLFELTMLIVHTFWSIRRRRVLASSMLQRKFQRVKFNTFHKNTPSPVKKLIKVSLLI